MKKITSIAIIFAFVSTFSAPIPALAGGAYSITGSYVISGLTVTLSGIASANPYVGKKSDQFIAVDWTGACSKDSKIEFNFDSIAFVGGNGNDQNGGSFTNATWSTSKTFASSGNYSICVKVYHANFNGAEGSDAATFTANIYVPPVNNAPMLDPIGSISGDELTNITFTAIANDADGDNLTFSTVGAPEGAVIDPSGGVFSWIPTEAQGPGVYTFDVCVSDGALQDCETITVTVNEANISPTVADVVVSAHENMPKVITASASDPDLPANLLSFFVVSAPLNGILDTAFTVNTITYTPNFGYLGSDSFTYKANDGLSDSNVATVYITVDNTSPIINQISDKTVLELNEIAFTATAYDNDGDTLTFSLEGTVPSGASITPDGIFSWTPTEEQGPSEYFITVKVSDNSKSDTTTFKITVGEDNQVPSVSDVNVNTTENVAVTVNMHGSDLDLPTQTLTYAIVDGPTNGTLGTVMNDQVVYTPNTGYVGSDSFTYKVNDGTDDSNTATVSINISDLSQCSDKIDNDEDGKIDSNDPGCSNTDDNDESDDPIVCDAGYHLVENECVPDENLTDVCANIEGNQETLPQGYRQDGENCVLIDDGDNNNGGGSSNSGNTSSNPVSSGGGSLSGGRKRDVGNLLASGGEVLGASTENLACEPYLNSYIKLGANNDPEEVKKLQIFLNQFFEVNNPVTGFYGPITYEMVKKFQLHQEPAVLTPWAIAGYPTDGPTGYVYKTTKRWINILKCPEMISTTPIPPLP